MRILKNVVLYLLIPILTGGLFLFVLNFEIKNLDSSVLSNFLMVLMTYFLVVFAWVSITKSKKESYYNNRAYIIFDIETDEGIFIFTLQNIGKTPAYDVKLNSEPDLQIFSISSLNSVFKNQIKFFPPGKIIKSDFDYSDEFFDREISPTITINYKDIEGLFHSEVVKIDLSFRKGLVYRKKKKIDDIVKSLEKINASVNKSGDKNKNK